MRILLLTVCLSLQAASYNISTIAGSDWVGENVPATSAILIQAEGVVTDPMGNLYISDANNHRVRCVSPNGNIRTIAGNGIAGFAGDNGPASASQLNSPYGLAFDFAGNLYIADLGNARIRQISPAGIITTVAGGGALPAGGKNEGSMAASLAFIAPRNIAIDGTGIVYISDFGAHRVYKMATDGTVTTLAGTGSPGYSGDGVAALAMLNYPTALAVDHQGNVYIADSANHLIRKVSGGLLTSIARSALPTGLAFDGVATLYVADHSAGEILEIPLSSGTATAMNVSATDVAYGSDGYLYIADITVARRANVFGVSSVIAGGGSLAEGDGGPATTARLNQPSNVAIDSIGNLYIADKANNRIRRVGLNGTITTLAGTGAAGNTGDGGAAMLATLNGPTSVTFDSYGNLYIADTGNARLRMVTSGGLIQSVPTPALSAPAYMMFDSAKNLYIADASAIFKVTPTGAATTLFAGLESPRGMVFDQSGNFYFTEPSFKQVWMFAPSGSHSLLAPGAWSSPQGIAVDAAGNILVADSGLNQILSVNSFGNVTPVSGTGTPGFGGDGGSALLAQLNAPSDVLVSPAGVYVTDSGNNRIRLLVGSATQATAAPLQVVTAVNAASLTPGPIAPGMLMALLGAGPAVTEVSFNAISAPILSVSPTEVLVRVPVALEGVQSVQISINDVAQITANVVDAAPALFADSNGQASVLNEDGTVNSPINPAARGSIMTLFGTGEGVTGLPFSLTVGGYACSILYAGPSGNYPGMFQINAQVPSGYLSAGTFPVMVGVGTFTTQMGLTVSVF
jgi:trimeric autotransporter adhesin